VAGIDRWRPLDGGDVAALEEAADNQVGEAQDRHGDAVKARPSSASAIAARAD